MKSQRRRAGCIPSSIHMDEIIGLVSEHQGTQCASPLKQRHRMGYFNWGNKNHVARKSNEMEIPKVCDPRGGHTRQVTRFTGGPALSLVTIIHPKQNPIQSIFTKD